MKRRSNTPDTEAVRLALAGDKEAFIVLLRRHQGSVWRLCSRILGSENEAQDVTQEAALQAYLGLETLREPERFGAWLHSIAANLARYRLRQQRRRPLLSLESLEKSAWQNAGHTTDRLLADFGPSPEDVRLARELHDEVLEAIKGLSEINREVVVGYYLQGYSYAELAELLGVPISTIKGRLHKGRKQLEPPLEPVARRVLGINREEKTMNEEQMAEVVVEDALKMPFDDERGLELLRSGGSLRNMPDLMDSEVLTGFPAVGVVLVLKEENGERVLPVWVGIREGLSIWSSVSGRETPRPMTHDLMREILATMNLEVKSVSVVRLVDQTFYGEIKLQQSNSESSIHQIDARPSDAIALAVRLESPIYVTQPVLEEAAFESKEALLTAQREGQGPFEK